MDEWAAAATCYTSGTTGAPKGVVYSHRSTFLHSFFAGLASTIGLTDHDRVLPIVPMYHVNAWGLPVAGWMLGSDFTLPGRHLQAEPLARLIAAERPTIGAAVPTIWLDLLRLAEARPGTVDLSSLRMIISGGSAVPRSLIEAYEQLLGVRIVQAWGMTETSPLVAFAHPPRGVEPGSAGEMPYRMKTGRVMAGVEVRLVADDGRVLAHDGVAVGEIEVRGPWVTGAYSGDPAPEKFDDGWLRTGDVGTIDAHGYLQITDRAKDVIKSGGEWISSVELENLLIAHPDVVEAAVVGIPDPRWDERPLACVVRAEGATVGPTELRDFLAAHLPRWQLPEHWAFLAEVPRTSVGKFDKKLLRAQHGRGELAVESLEGPGASRLV